MKPLHRLLAVALPGPGRLWRNALVVPLLLVASLASAVTEYPAGDLIFEDHLPLGTPGKRRPLLETVEYSNVSNFLGEAAVNGGTTLEGKNLITRLRMDDITPAGLSAGGDVTRLKFTMANFNSVPVTVRPRIRFWFDDRGTPGSFYNLPTAVGFSFTPLTITPGLTIVTATIAPGEFSMPAGTFWAGITFDNDNGATGATQAQLDLIGQGIFDPPDVGASGDVMFSTTSAGSFFSTDSPPGTLFNFAGAPPANAGWEFTDLTPTPATQSSWGRIKHLYK